MEGAEEDDGLKDGGEDAERGDAGEEEGFTEMGR